MAAICSSRTSKLSLVTEATAKQTSEISEVDIILACQKGDKRAFEVLLKSQQRAIHRILNKMAPDWSSSHDDMAQEVNVRIYRSIHTLRNPRAFRRWLHQLVTNLFYDQLRKKPPLNTCSIDEPLGDEEGASGRDIPDTRNQPDEVLERQEIVDVVNAAIETLPLQFKKAIILRELHGLAYDEIAHVTNSDLGTVKSRIARGRAKIQPFLNPLRCA